MRHVLSAVVGSLLLSSAAFAAKPPPPSPSPPPNPQIAYRLLSGKSIKLIVANENNTGASTLYSSATPFTFDLAPRAQRQIAIVDGPFSAPSLKLLTYTTNATGGFAPGTVTTLGPARSGSAIDFSPDGTKIAYACCSDGEKEQLVVQDIATGAKTVWAEAPYFWDVSWFRNGASLVYATLIPLEVREIAAPMAEPQLLYSNGQGEIYIDSSRTNPDRLVISYNDTSGAARIGLWQAGGGFVDSDLARSARSWQGTLNCDDTKLAYMGVQNTSGSQAFYIRDLNTTATSLVSKNSNILLQFWPTCS